MRDILTDRQWLFLSRLAESHNTTLETIARAVLGNAAPAAGPRPARGTDRKLVKDRARCAAAIAACEFFLQRDDHKFCAHTHDSKHAGPCCASVRDEMRRLQAAYDNPAMLWKIYRRADKATGYDVAAVPARKAA